MSLVNNTRPCAGDVVVHKDATPAGGYVLSVFRHASQLSFGTRDEAIRGAVAFATRDHVDAWYTDDCEVYESMARRRRGQRRKRTDS